MGLASASAAPHHRAQAAAVDKIDLAELENDRSVKGQEVLDVSAQKLRLAAGNNAPFAAHDRDPTNLARFQRQSQELSLDIGTSGLVHNADLMTLTNIFRVSINVYFAPAATDRAAFSRTGHMALMKAKM
jgi:hypothetical protein